MTSLTGNLVYPIDSKNSFNLDDPKKARVRLTIARNNRDRDGNDTGADFFPVTVFGYQAINLANSNLPKGTTLTVDVALGTYDRKVFDEDGEESNLTMVGLTAREVAVSLRWATVEVSKTSTSKDSGKSRTEDDSAASGSSDSGQDEGGEDAAEKKAPARRTAGAGRGAGRRTAGAKF